MEEGEDPNIVNILKIQIASKTKEKTVLDPIIFKAFNWQLFFSSAKQLKITRMIIKKQHKLLLQNCRTKFLHNT